METEKETIGGQAASNIPEAADRPLKFPRPPVQLELFGNAPEPADVVFPEDEPLVEEGRILELDEGVSLAQSSDGSQLIISGFGFHLSKKSERLVVKNQGKAVYEFPFFRLSEIVIQSRGVSISSDLIEELCGKGIKLAFMGFSGKPYAMLSSPMQNAVVQTRREQILAFTDKRGFEFSKRVVAGKLGNQAKLIKYFAKYLKQADSERFVKLQSAADSIEAVREKVKGVCSNCVDASRETLMGFEGASAQIYWNAVKEIIGERTEFFGRQHAGAADIVNALLNYGYGILYSQVWGAVLNAGLEPFAGFLHVDRPGKPSLVLDMVEEFRQPVVDRVVIAYLDLGESKKMENGLLTAETRKRFGERIIERLNTAEPYRGKRYQIRSIIQLQARDVASFLRGTGDYKPFSFKW